MNPRTRDAHHPSCRQPRPVHRRRQLDLPDSGTGARVVRCGRRSRRAPRGAGGGRSPTAPRSWWSRTPIQTTRPARRRWRRAGPRLLRKIPWPAQDDAAIAWQPLADGQVIDSGEGPLVVLHTPGHAPDHVVLWHAESRTLFGADLMQLGNTVAIPADHGGDLAAYLRSLRRVQALSPARVLPGAWPAHRGPSGGHRAVPPAPPSPRGPDRDRARERACRPWTRSPSASTRA